MIAKWLLVTTNMPRDHMSRTSNEVRIARIGRPHGIRGEVTAEVFTDSAELRFANGSCLRVYPKNNVAVPLGTLTVEKSRWNKKILLLKFVEFSDRNTAELLRGSELYADPTDDSDNDNSWYAHELIGAAVHQETFDSSAIGTVTDLIAGDAQDLLEVQLLDGRKVLIPFVYEIVPEIDEEQGFVVITPPPGLLELNQD